MIVFLFTNDFINFILAGLGVGVFIFLMTIIFIPESPRYYAAKGDYKNTFKIYRYLARMHPDRKVL